MACSDRLILIDSKILKDRVKNDPDGDEVAASHDVPDQTCYQGSDSATQLNTFNEDDWTEVVKYMREAVRNYSRPLAGGERCIRGQLQ